MIDFDLQPLTPHRARVAAILCVGWLAAGCVSDAGLGDVPGETEGGGASETAAETDSPATTTTDPGTAESTAGETEPNETDASETDGVPDGMAGCERIAGGEDDPHDWALVCASVASDGVQLLEVTPGGDVIVGVEVANFGDVENPTWEIDGSVHEHQDLTDLLLLRFDAQGELLWHRYFGSDAHVWFTAMAACGEDIVIAGDVGDAGVDLGEGPLMGDEFVARFDADGALLWTRTFEAQGPSGHITTLDLDCDAAGNVVLAGRARDGVDFGLGMQPAGIYDGFVARLDAAGDPVFGQPLLFDAVGDGGVRARGLGVAAHDDGSTYLFLDHSGPVDFGTGPLSNPQGGENAMLVRLSDTGALQWQAAVDGEGLVYARSLAIDAAGRAVVAGSFLSFIDLGGQTYENVFPYDEQEEDIVGTNYDVYVAAFEADGTYAWGVPAGWMRDENAVLVDYADGEALVYRNSVQQLTFDAYDQDGAQTWLGADLAEPSSGFQYQHVAANASAVVLGGGVDASTTWPLAVGPHARGQSDALVVHFPR